MNWPRRSRKADSTAVTAWMVVRRSKVCRPRPPASRSAKALRMALRTLLYSPRVLPSTSGRASAMVLRMASPPGTSPRPVWPALSLRMTMLRVNQGPWAPERLSSMLSWPATGMTCRSVTVGAPEKWVFMGKTPKMCWVVGERLLDQRFREGHALDLADDEEVADDGHGGIGADEDQGAREGAGGLQDVADDDGGGDAGGVAEGVEQTAGEAARFLRGGVGHHRPAQGTHALAEEGQGHHRDHEHVGLDVVAGDHAGGHQHADHDGGLAGNGQGVAALGEAVGQPAAGEAAQEARDGRQGGHEAGLEDGHASLLDQVDREPGEEEVGEGGDAVLADIDAQQHAVAQQFLDARPGMDLLGLVGGLGTVEIDQGAALLQVLQFAGADGGVVLGTIDGLEPREGHEDAQPAHEEEDARPAIGVHQPAHDRREEHGGEVLGGVEDRRRQSPFVGGKPGGSDPAVTGEGGRFRRTHQQPQGEERGDRGSAGQEADRSLEDGEERPQEDAEEVGDLRTEAVQQPAAGQLGKDVGPGEGREDVTHLHRGKPQRLLDLRTGDGNGRAVRVVDGGNDEQDRQDAPASPRSQLARNRRADGVVNVFHDDLLLMRTTMRCRGLPHWLWARFWEGIDLGSTQLMTEQIQIMNQSYADERQRRDAAMERAAHGSANSLRMLRLKTPRMGLSLSRR